MNLIKRFLTKNPCYTGNVNKIDSRYTEFQKNGPKGLMLHSVGCAQPSAMAFINNWDNANYTYSCVHGIIDANTGDAYQLLPWNFRGWHGGGSSNNTHVGVEMCESGYIKYDNQKDYSKFSITNKAKAQADCKRAYDTAVELFASICKEYNLNPLTDICSHYEGGKKGIASGHGDPEHYWRGLGMSYTMDGFRADVKKAMEPQQAPAPSNDDIKAELTALINKKFVEISTSLSNAYSKELTTALATIGKQLSNAIDSADGKYIEHLKDIPSKDVKADIQALLDCGAINGGTPENVDDSDIRMRYQDVRVMAVLKRYVDYVTGGKK